LDGVEEVVFLVEDGVEEVVFLVEDGVGKPLVLLSSGNLFVGVDLTPQSQHRNGSISGAFCFP
jgi:hypothetical protein